MATVFVEDLVWCTTTTAGSGPFTATVVAGNRSFSIFANGTLVSYTRSDSSGSFEEAEGTVSTSGGVTTITQTAVLKSSNSNAAVSWAAGGTQNVRCAPGAGSYMNRRNKGVEWALDGAGDTVCGNVGAATDGVRGLSGGSDGRVVRYTSSATVANALNTDTNDQLGSLLFRSGGKYYRPGDLVVGLSGLTAGQTYWLGDNTTNLLTTAPTPTSSLRLVKVGKAFSTTTLQFRPSEPIGA